MVEQVPLLLTLVGFFFLSGVHQVDISLLCGSGKTREICLAESAKLAMAAQSLLAGEVGR